MPRKRQSTSAAPKLTCQQGSASDRLDLGLRRLDLLTKLMWEFYAAGPVTLDHWEHLTLLEYLDDIALDLHAGQNALITENNALELRERERHAATPNAPNAETVSRLMKLCKTEPPTPEGA